MMTQTIQKQIADNKNKTLYILSVFTILITALVFLFTKSTGQGWHFAFIALIVSLASSFTSYYWSDKIILTMSGAKEADRKKEAVLFQIIENISKKAQIPTPRVYVIEDSALNAFATGRDPQHALICVTRGLLEKLDVKELEGVVAHEMSHITNFDIRLMAIVAVLAGTVIFIADMFWRKMYWGRGNDRGERNAGGNLIGVLGLLFALLTPLIATLVQLSISRKREYLADASGAMLTQNPEGLAMALAKISSDKKTLRSASNATAHLYIASPFKSKSTFLKFTNLFETHPPIEERIAILKSM